METVTVKTYALPPIDKNEVLRYLGTKAGDAETDALILDCFEEAKDRFVGKVCYAELPVSVKGDEVDFGFAKVTSAALAKAIRSCKTAVLFAATVGIGIDRLIRKYTGISPARAVCLQALGAERIEALCDVFQTDVCQKNAKEGKKICPRFSPGYGDLPLSFQTEVFRLLDCPRKIGVALNESLLMSPAKSVTAIIGVREGLVT